MATGRSNNGTELKRSTQLMTRRHFGSRLTAAVAGIGAAAAVTAALAADKQVTHVCKGMND
jgi:hypothetical protein